MTERIIVVCPICNTEVKLGEWFNGARTSRCECGKTNMLHLDGGKLDLEEVRRTVENDSYDFEIFP